VAGDNGVTVFDTNSLITLYQETWREITRLRKYEWQITYYFIILNGGLIAFLISDNAACLICLISRIVLTIIIFIAALFGIGWLFKTHEYLSEQRNIRRKIEERIGFDDVKTPAGDPILPVEWKGRKIYSKFQRMGLIIPFTLTIIVIHAFSIYVVWMVPGC
jgi:hypothetical protein